MLRNYVVKDEAGLHARPLSKLVNFVAQYDVPIHLIYQDKKVPLHSMLMAMSLGVPTQGTFTISVESDDANVILDHLEKLMKEEALID